jgi:hypothetical protein
MGAWIEIKMSIATKIDEGVSPPYPKISTENSPNADAQRKVVEPRDGA